MRVPHFVCQQNCSLQLAPTWALSIWSNTSSHNKVRHVLFWMIASTEFWKKSGVLLILIIVASFLSFPWFLLSLVCIKKKHFEPDDGSVWDQFCCTGPLMIMEEEITSWRNLFHHKAGKQGRHEHAPPPPLFECFAHAASGPRLVYSLYCQKGSSIHGCLVKQTISRAWLPLSTNKWNSGICLQKAMAQSKIGWIIVLPACTYKKSEWQQGPISN